MKKIFRNNKGISLVELLIVFSIIAVLAAIIFGNLFIIPRMRDAQRKSDLAAIQHALEQYKADQDVYPYDASTGVVNLINCPVGSPSSFGNSTDAYAPSRCSKIYSNEIPTDPNGSGAWNNGNYQYYSLDGRRYYILACAENSKDKQNTTGILSVKLKIWNVMKQMEAVNLLDATFQDCNKQIGYFVFSP